MSKNTSEPVKHRAVGEWRIESAEEGYNVLDATDSVIATFFGPDAFYCAIAFMFAPKLVGIVRRADMERRLFDADWYEIGRSWLEREIAIIVDRINTSVPDQERNMK